MKRIKTQQGLLGVLLSDMVPEAMAAAKADPDARVLTVIALVDLPATQQSLTYISGIDDVSVVKWNLMLEQVNDATVTLERIRLLAAVPDTASKH